MRSSKQLLKLAATELLDYTDLTTSEIEIEVPVDGWITRIRWDVNTLIAPDVDVYIAHGFQVGYEVEEVGTILYDLPEMDSTTGIKSVMSDNIPEFFPVESSATPRWEVIRTLFQRVRSGEVLKVKARIVNKGAGMTAGSWGITFDAEFLVGAY